MSTLQLANLAFESTDNNQIQFSSSILSFTLGGANDVFRSNSSVVSLKIYPTTTNISNTTGTQTYTSNLVVNNLTTNGQIIYSGNVSPTLLSASTSDWNPGFANAYFIRVSSNTTISLYGMVEGVNGQIVVLNNIGNSAIILVSEDTNNENNASRRFELPNNITLFPASSISLIYDGLSQRWKGKNTIGITPSNKSHVTKGFFGSGYHPNPGFPASGYVTNISKITFSNDTSAYVPTGGLSIPKGCSYAGGTGTGTKGYLFGGNGLTGCCILPPDRVNYTSETVALVPGASLVAGRFGGVSVGNDCKGFHGIGYAAPNPATPNVFCNVLTVCRTIYSTETTSVAPPVNNIKFCSGGIGNSTKGFFLSDCCAANPPDRISYATETSLAVPGASLVTLRYGVAASGNDDKAYISGGGCNVGGRKSYKTVCRLTYSSDTIATVPGANLSEGKTFHGAVGDSNKGFHSGGSIAGGGAPSTRFVIDSSDITDVINYATETSAIAPLAKLYRPWCTLAGIK